MVLRHRVHQLAQIVYAVAVGNRVKTGVGAELIVPLSVVVSDTAEVNLHHPAVLGILLGNRQQNRRLVSGNFLFGQSFSGKTFGKDRLQLLLGSGLISGIIQRMVGSAAAHLVEEINAVVQSLFHVRKGFNLHACHAAQLFDILCKAGFLNVHGFVRAHCRQNLYLAGGVGSNLFVPLQRIGRVVCGANQLHIRLVNDAAHRHIFCFQALVAGVINLLRRFCIQRLGDAEIFFQFQIRPVIQGVADGLRQGFRPALKGAVRVGIFCAGNIALGHTIAAHCAPLIVVAAQPNLGNRVIAAVLGNLLRVNMAVIVDDGHFCRVFMIQLFRCFGFEQKVFVHKGFHVNLTFLLFKMDYM